MIDQVGLLTSPLMLDVDTGVDDALAIAFALRSGANLIGVSTVAGNVSVDLATDNTLRVLSWMGAESAPVHRGSSRPLLHGFYDAAHDVHGENGLGGAELSPGGISESSINGVDALLTNAARFEGELIVVAVGPLTNIAIALNLCPALTRQIRKLVIMGGAYFSSGNITPRAEFNAYADPHAFAQVVEANWSEIVVVGLDVTHQTIISRDQWDATPADATGAAGLVSQVTGRTFTDRKLDGFFLHDPLAVGIALHPDLAELRPHAISVDTQGQRGKTTPAEGGRVEVAISVDAHRFERLFSDRMGIVARTQNVEINRAE